MRHSGHLVVLEDLGEEHASLERCAMQPDGAGSAGQSEHCPPPARRSRPCSTRGVHLAMDGRGRAKRNKKKDASRTWRRTRTIGLVSAVWHLRARLYNAVERCSMASSSSCGTPSLTRRAFAHFLRDGYPAQLSDEMPASAASSTCTTSLDMMDRLPPRAILQCRSWHKEQQGGGCDVAAAQQQVMKFNPTACLSSVEKSGKESQREHSGPDAGAWRRQRPSENISNHE